MSVYRFPAVLLLGFSISISLTAQTWTGFTVNNSGLPGNSIYDLAIDSMNNIWVATEAGLGMYDSTNWHAWDYTNSPIPQSSNNTCYSVYVDKAQNIWLGTDYGHLLRFDGDTSWTDFSTIGFGDINTIREDQDSILWVGHYYGLKSFDGATWTDHTTHLPDDYVISIEIDTDGNLWFGTRQGLTLLDTLGNWATYDPSNSGLIDDRIEAIKRAPDGSLWIGTPDGIHRWDSLGNWTVYHSSNSPLWDDEVNSIDIDLDSIIWISNDAASMAAFHQGVWTNYFYPSGYSFSRRILIDLNGMKWIATQSGLLKFDDGGSGPIYTGASNENNAPILKAYPNPSSGALNLEVTAKGEMLTEVVIFDLDGRLHVEQVVNSRSVCINLSHLLPGTYLAKAIVRSGKTFTRKVIVRL